MNFKGLTMRVRQSWASCLVLLLLGGVCRPAQAQSCPSGYGACDNGGCCLNSEQCCPKIAEGCCPAHTPFCCGDGTCASSPSECGTASGLRCPGFDVPCGLGCIPAGSECCDDEGHYCVPQSTCSSAIACLTGLDSSPARLVEAKTENEPPPAPARRISPILDPPDGTARSCALSPPAAPGAAISKAGTSQTAASNTAASNTVASGWGLLAAGIVLAGARRRPPFKSRRQFRSRACCRKTSNVT
jgi:hypothetical protein